MTGNRKVLGVVTAMCLLASACSSGGGAAANARPRSGSAAAASGSITVLAAASLTDTFRVMKARFEATHPGARITYSFGPSSDLATQITEGNPADVFASASVRTMDQVDRAGDAGTVGDFASNTMEIATPPGNPKHIASVQDLATKGVQVALCDFAVPCGVVAKQVFDNAHVTIDPVARQQDVKSTIALVESGEVDAGIVYVTDVAAAGDKVVGVAIPAAVNARTTYPIAVLNGARNADLARAFVDYVLSTDGQQILRHAGFAPA